jgi:diaminopimelate decarboxylase
LNKWKSKGDELLIGKSPISDLFRSGDAKTPVYLYDAGIILDQINLLKQSFPDFSFLYSIKSNPTLAIASLVRQAGLGVEIVSLGELGIIQRAGFDINEVAVTDPANIEDVFSQYIDANIGLLGIGSEQGIKMVSALCERKKVKKTVIIRVNPQKNHWGSHENMGGASKFGIPEDEVVDVIKRNRSEYIDFKGFHIFTGSQILEPEFLIENFVEIAEMSKDLSNRSGIRLEHIDFGGGFGVPYSKEEHPLDIVKIGKEASRKLSNEFKDPATKPQFYLELGRYLVAEAGLFLTRVIELKKSGDINYVLTDSGINNFARPAMPWAMQHPCAIISKISKKPNNTYKIVGPLCQPSDILCKEAWLPEPEPGDVIAFFNAGAYGYTMSPQFYHSRDLPAEIMYYQDEFFTIRERLTYDDFLAAHPQSIPDQLKVKSLKIIENVRKY